MEPIGLPDINLKLPPELERALAALAGQAAGVLTIAWWTGAAIIAACVHSIFRNPRQP